MRIDQTLTSSTSTAVRDARRVRTRSGNNVRRLSRIGRATTIALRARSLTCCTERSLGRIALVASPGTIRPVISIRERWNCLDLAFVLSRRLPPSFAKQPCPSAIVREFLDGSRPPTSARIGSKNCSLDRKLAQSIATSPLDIDARARDGCATLIRAIAPKGSRGSVTSGRIASPDRSLLEVVSQLLSSLRSPTHHPIDSAVERST
jgi:hypothetical protein